MVIRWPDLKRGNDNERQEGLYAPPAFFIDSGLLFFRIGKASTISHRGLIESAASYSPTPLPEQYHWR